MYSCQTSLCQLSIIYQLFLFFHYCVLLNNCEVSFLRHFSISLIITFHGLYDAFNYVISFVSYISHCAKSYLLMDVRKTYIFVCCAYMQCIFLSGSYFHIKTHTHTHFALYSYIESSLARPKWYWLPQRIFVDRFSKAQRPLSARQNNDQTDCGIYYSYAELFL